MYHKCLKSNANIKCDIEVPTIHTHINRKIADLHLLRYFISTLVQHTLTPYITILCRQQSTSWSVRACLYVMCAIIVTCIKRYISCAHITRKCIFCSFLSFICHGKKFWMEFDVIEEDSIRGVTICLCCKYAHTLCHCHC